jgi:ABC-type Co2+ transport system permease subunit
MEVGKVGPAYCQGKNGFSMGGVGVSCTDLILTPICGIVPFSCSQLACNAM